ncbi:hypothetical protein D3C71_1906200 [compost metagenome]
MEITTESTDRFINNPDQLKRFKKFAEFNIRTLCLSVRGADGLIGNMDDVIAHIDHLSRDISPISQHRVVRCTYDLFTRVRNESGQFASISVPKRFSCTVKDVYW